MSTKKNKELIRHAYELQNRRELDKYFKLFTPDYIENTTAYVSSQEQAKQGTLMFFNAFPDVKATIEDLVAEGDKVAIRVTWKGTHKGEYMGIAPKNKQLEMTNTAIFQISNGKIKKCWATIDGLRVLRQLGVIPK